MGGAVTAARQRAVTAARDGALLVVGDVVTDIVARHRTALAPGTDTAAAIRTVPGGAGANVACWAAPSAEHLKKQWAEAAARIGIKLDPEYSAGPL
ncbi:hypothetical protein ABZ369_12310, partial [Streptomyces sp. NPDC005918]